MSVVAQDCTSFNSSFQLPTAILGHEKYELRKKKQSVQVNLAGPATESQTSEPGGKKKDKQGNIPLLEFLVDLHHLGTFLRLDSVPRSGVRLCPNDFKKESAPSVCNKG